MLHKVRATLKTINNHEMHVPILSLVEVLDVYTSHLKYLRRHTLTVLLSQSRVADQIRSQRKSITMFLDLDIGLTNKDLTITLDRCPSLDNEVIGKFVYHADKSLE